MKKNNKLLHDIGSLTFDIFETETAIEDRKIFLPVVSLKIIFGCDLRPIVNDDKLVDFLTKVQSTYMTDVSYHNDLHGVDVMQMGYYLL